MKFSGLYIVIAAEIASGALAGEFQLHPKHGWYLQRDFGISRDGIFGAPPFTYREQTDCMRELGFEPTAVCTFFHFIQMNYF